MVDTFQLTLEVISRQYKLELSIHFFTNCVILFLIFLYYLTIALIWFLSRPVARGVRGPLENQRSTFWNLAREIIKANNYKWLTIYLHQLLCTKPPTKWLQISLAKEGLGVPTTDYAASRSLGSLTHPLLTPPLRLGLLRACFHSGIPLNLDTFVTMSLL